MPQLSRDFNERKALVRGLINALIRNETIETTDVKAKAIRGVIDSLITQAKKETQNAFRQVHSFLEDETNSEKIIKEIAPSLKTRSSGYTRITNIGKRKGDNALIVRVEFSSKIEKPKPNSALHHLKESKSPSSAAPKHDPARKKATKIAAGKSRKVPA